MIAATPAQSSARAAWGAEIRATLALAWPLILINLAQMALGVTDVIFMGWLGPEALAAGALATNLHFAFLIFAIGLVTATSPLIAIELGRRRHSVRDVRRTVRQGLWVAVAISVPFWLILWQGELILLALGQEPRLARIGATYLHTYQWSLLPFLVFVVLRNFVSAKERPLAAMWIGLASVVVNAVLVYALIFGRFGLPALGLPGAGIGTTLTNTFMAVGLALLVVRDRRFRRYRLFGHVWRSDWKRFREIWRLGLPIAGTLAFEVTGFNAAVFLVGLISTEALAAHAIAIQIPALAFMIPLGLGMAATVRVGLAFGAGNPVGVGRAGWTAYGIGLIYACATAVVILVFARDLVGVFLDRADPANQTVIGLAVGFLMIAGLFQLVDAAQAVGAGMLRGLGDTRVPMVFAAVGFWVIGLPLGAALAFLTGLAGLGIWIGLAAGLAVVAALMTLRWLVRARLGLTLPHPPDPTTDVAKAAAEAPAVTPGAMT